MEFLVFEEIPRCNVIAFTSPLTPEYVLDVLQPIKARVSHLPIQFHQLHGETKYGPETIIAQAVGGLHDTYSMDTPLMDILLDTFPFLVTRYQFVPLPIAPPPLLAFSTWDDAKVVRDAFPDVHTIVFVPAVCKPLSTGGKPLERRCWDSQVSLADAVCTYVTSQAALRNKVLVVPSDNLPHIPPISSLNLVTGQSFAYGAVLGDVKAAPSIAPADGCTRAAACSLYMSTGTPELCVILQRLLTEGFDAGSTDPTPVTGFQCNDFGCVQVLTHLLEAPDAFNVPSVLSNAAFACQNGEPFPKLTTLSNWPVNGPEVSMYMFAHPDMPLAKAVSLCAQGPSFVDAYLALFGTIKMDTVPVPSEQYTVYGRYARNPCPYTVDAVECLLKHGQKVKVVEVPSAADSSIPKDKPATHTTVPVIYQKCGSTEKYIGGCAEVRKLFTP